MGKGLIEKFPGVFIPAAYWQNNTTNRSNTMKHSIYIVTIHGTDHAVRATGKRAAQTIALDARVSTRLAGHDDIVRICSSRQEILGEQPGVDPDQAAPIDSASADTSEA